MNGIILALASIGGFIATIVTGYAVTVPGSNLADVVIFCANGMLTAVCFGSLAIVEALNAQQRLLRALVEAQRAPATIRRDTPTGDAVIAIDRRVPAQIAPNPRRSWVGLTAIGGIVLIAAATAVSFFAANSRPAPVNSLPITTNNQPISVTPPVPVTTDLPAFTARTAGFVSVVAEMCGLVKAEDARTFGRKVTTLLTTMPQPRRDEATAEYNNAIISAGRAVERDRAATCNGLPMASTTLLLDVARGLRPLDLAHSVGR